MNKKDNKASLKISREVIETIASVAAMEVDGVAEISEPHGNLQGVFNNPLSKQKIETVITNGIAEIGICITLELGANIAKVCSEVQKNIKENVQTMTGIIVNRVNVTVMGVNLPANSKLVDSEEK